MKENVHYKGKDVNKRPGHENSLEITTFIASCSNRLHFELTEVNQKVEFVHIALNKKSLKCFDSHSIYVRSQTSLIINKEMKLMGQQ